MSKYKIYLACGHSVTVDSELDLESFCKKMNDSHVQMWNDHVAIFTEQIAMIEKLEKQE